MILNKAVVVILLGVSVFVAACSGENKESGGAGSSSYSAEQETKSEKAAAKHLAYIHQLTVQLESQALAETYKKIVFECQQDRQFTCVVLDADLNTSSFAYGNLKLRLKPAGVPYFSGLASSKGDVHSRSTTAEDLGEKILDSVKRIEMLTSYRSKLEALEARPSADIDALVKIASELSKVQNELEHIQGKSAKLLQRVETDLLNIRLSPSSDQSFFEPIFDAFDEFGSDLSYGISSVILAFAYLVPWTIFLIIFFFILRMIYRFIMRKKRI